MSKPTLGRPSDRRNLIVRFLRDQIVQGTLQPGAQLPTRTDIEERFGAGPMTVQRALDQLGSDGFVEARGSRGTFVTQFPPHVARIGLVFPAAPHEWNRYWTALNIEAQKLAAGLRDRSLAFYYGVDGHSDSEDFQRLLRDLENQRIGGLIFTSTPQLLRNTPVLDMPGIPRVAWSMGKDDGVLGVNTDNDMWLERALQFLKLRGRSKVAVIMPPTDDRHAQWEGPILAAGMQTHPHWLQSVYLRDRINARYLVQLLMHCDEKPDALLIADDNLVEHCTQGLLAMGEKRPKDLAIVAHCNYPLLPESHVPVQFLGFDSRQVLHACMESIEGQRRGKKLPATTYIPALFEHEVPFKNEGAL